MFLEFGHGNRVEGAFLAKIIHILRKRAKLFSYFFAKFNVLEFDHQLPPALDKCAEPTLRVSAAFGPIGFLAV
jgi:hypothetical protein